MTAKRARERKLSRWNSMPHKWSSEQFVLKPEPATVLVSLVGGPCDGQQITVPGDCFLIEVGVPAISEAAFFEDGIFPEEFLQEVFAPRARVEVYLRKGPDRFEWQQFI